MTPEIGIQILDFDAEAQRPGVPELPFDTVHVWRKVLSGGSTEADTAYGLLSGQERRIAERYRVEGARQNFILTRGALRLLLGDYLRSTPEEIVFGVTEFGKPFIEGNVDVQFNVSHTDGLALLGFTRKRQIGVDVEKIRFQDDPLGLAERYFSSHETENLKKLSGDELETAFFRCWSRKEAYIKARGEGLSLPLDRFDVSVESRQGQVLLATRPDASEAERSVVLDLHVGGGYAAAVAVEVSP